MVRADVACPDVVTADRLIAADHLIAAGVDGPGWLRIEGSRIAQIGSGTTPHAPDDRVATLFPGLVDTHVHGAYGVSFDSGSPDEIRDAVDGLHSLGTTTLLASLVTATIDELCEQVAKLVPLCESGLFAGIHLEGPWLSPQFKGAHDETKLTAPTPESVRRLLDLGRGHVAMVTIAPELPGAIEAIRILVAAGVRVAFGHSAADADQTRESIEAGVSIATHLFNAMRPVHHRQTGPIPVLLADPRVTVELIADGVHVDPTVIAMAFRAARGGMVFVSDSMSATCLSDGSYDLGGLAITVREKVARVDATGSIAGSTSPLADALPVAMAGGLSLEQAVTAASTTPAQLHRLDAGRIEPGAHADLVEWDGSVTRVMRRGTWLPAPRPVS